MILVVTYRTDRSGTIDETVKHVGADSYHVDDKEVLYVSQSDKLVASYSSGNWKSVSIEQQNPASSLSSEVKTGEWVDIQDQNLIYDTSGVSFIRGVTNFDVENVSDALRLLKMPQKREDVTLLLDVTLFNRLDDTNQLEYYSNGVRWRRFNLELSPVSQELGSGCVATLIRHKSGKVVKLITREF